MCDSTGYCGNNQCPDTLAQANAQLKDMIRQLLDTSGVYKVDHNGPDGFECPWCNEVDEHNEDCLRHKAEKLLE